MLLSLLQFANLLPFNRDNRKLRRLLPRNPRQIVGSFRPILPIYIIAIYGFNITIIAAIFVSLFHRTLGVRRGTFLAGLGIALYTVLVGADVAVVRAAIMGGITLPARILGRRTHGFAALSAAAIVMTVFNPEVLWDVGFQLSFATAPGLILNSPPLEAWLKRIYVLHTDSPGHHPPPNNLLFSTHPPLLPPDQSHHPTGPAATHYHG
jgi:ComEC/Rec2-related protein